MKFKTCYSYHPETGVYQGETDAWESPLEPGIFPLPAHATFIEPPKYSENQIPSFQMDKSEWIIVEDHRGKQVWDKVTKEPSFVQTPGLIPDNLTLQEPPFDHLMEWDGKGWSITLENMKKRKAEEISIACAQFIEAGFTSSALGDTYTYPAKITDQQNLAASALDSLLNADDPTWTTPFWCQDSKGNWDYKEHTAKQIQQVAKEGKAKILATLAKKKSLSEKINVATTVEEVNAITWE